MAKIYPFRALRYNPTKVQLQQVVTQPYDKISPELQDRYYSASPYNLVRVILGKPEAGDDENHNVYRRAAASLQQWRDHQVLVPDDRPCLYLYTQTFQVPGDPAETVAERRGFIALGQVEDYDNKVVFRHEQTLSKPKADRLNLLRATQAHFGQIFMLYSDPAAEVDSALRQDGPPDTEVTDEYGVVHRLWKVSDPEVIARVQAKMADKKLIIADGHHRYETSLNHRNALRESKKGGAEAPYERVMMTFVNMDAPGLVILPTHRVVFGLENFSAGDFIQRVRQYFRVEDLGAIGIAEATEKLREAGVDDTALLAVTANSKFLLRAKEGLESELLDGLSERQRALDVVRLHKLVLEGTLGMSEEDIREQKHLKYVREANTAAGEVLKGANLALLMNPAHMEQVRDIAFGGEVLPQKSTDFFPKLLSGLTIYSLGEAEKDTPVAVEMKA